MLPSLLGKSSVKGMPSSPCHSCWRTRAGRSPALIWHWQKGLPVAGQGPFLPVSLQLMDENP